MANEIEEDDEQPVVKEDKKKTDIELTEVVTQTSEAFKLPNGEIVGLNDYLVWLGNQIMSIKKSVA